MGPRCPGSPYEKIVTEGEKEASSDVNSTRSSINLRLVHLK